MDSRLLTDPYVTMFWRPALLTEAADGLRGAGYDVRATDAGGWREPSGMHDALAQLLDFPGYYGRNLDALNDCLSDVAAGSYGSNAGARGLALLLWRYDAFTHRHPKAAFALLDIFAVQARGAALAGRPMVCLVQSDDPELSFPPVGARPVGWNDAEWLHSRRLPS